MQVLDNKLTYWLNSRNFAVFVVILLLLEALIYKDFIFGNSLFIFKDLGDDSYTQCYPVMVQRMESLRHGIIPQWSFHNGLGENTYPFWLEPVSITIIYTFFKENVASGMLWVQLVQTFLAGIIFFTLLRSLKAHPVACITGGLLYAFCGYVVIYGSWFLFEHSAYYVYFALLLLGLEQLISSKRWWLIPIAICLLAIIQPFSVYFAAIASVLYLLIRFSDLHFSIREQLATAGKVGLGAVLGLGLSAFLLLSNLHQMANSPRGSGEFPAVDTLSKHSMFTPANINELATAFLRLFSGNMQGSPDHYSGWINYLEAPVLCSSLLVLLLIPQLFHFISKRQKITYGGILLFFLLVCSFPFIRYAIWLFAGNYYRTISLLFILFTLIFAMKALHAILLSGRFYIKTFVISVATTLAILFLSLSAGSNESSPSVFIVIVFLLFHATLLYFFYKKKIQPYFNLLFISLVVFELIVFVSPILSERKTLTSEEMNSKTGYNDATLKVLKSIHELDPSFYRVEKDYYSGTSRVNSYNEAKVQGFYGTHTYYSFNSIHYVHFLNSIGLLKEQKEPDTRWIGGILSSPTAMRLCSVKYLLIKNDSISKYKRLGFDSIKNIRGITLLKTAHALPLGFTYDSYIMEKDFLLMEKPTRQTALLKAAVVKEDLAEELTGMKKITRIIMNNDCLDSTFKNIDKLKEDTLAIQSFSDNNIKGIIQTRKQKLLFFSIPFDEGWKLTIDGTDVKIHKLFAGLIGVPISGGKHTIELNFQDVYKTKGTIISLCSLVLFVSLMTGKAIYRKKKNALKETS